MLSLPFIPQNTEWWKRMKLFLPVEDNHLLSILKIISSTSTETQSISSSHVYLWGMVQSLECHVFCSACGHSSSLSIRFFALLFLSCPWLDLFCLNDSKIHISALPFFVVVVHLDLFWFEVLLYTASHFTKTLHMNKENNYFWL